MAAPIGSVPRIAVSSLPPPTRPEPGTPLPEDDLSARDAAGVTLDAHFEWHDRAVPATTPELDASGVRAARGAVKFAFSVDLVAAGRMRLAIGTATFPLPLGSEIRARYDHYGHALVWPNGARYRMLGPGALRVVLAERRADVTPLLTASMSEPKGRTRLGIATNSRVLENALGKLTLEQGVVEGAGLGGPLLCRTLVELIGIEPSVEPCASTEGVPLHARYEWADGGGLDFIVDTVTRAPELRRGLVQVPPPGARFASGELPPGSAGIFLTRDELLKFRTRDAPGERAPDAPPEGVTAVNATDHLQYLVVDGVPIAWVAPHAETYLIGLRAGLYNVGWRTFLSQHPTSVVGVTVPARIVAGRPDEPDAGKLPP